MHRRSALKTVDSYLWLTSENGDSCVDEVVVDRSLNRCHLALVGAEFFPIHNSGSPCFQNYSSCLCVYQDFVHSGDTAFPGKCDNSCYNLIPFLVILFFIVFVTACGQNPSLIITLR